MKRLLLLLTMFISIASFANFQSTTPLFGVPKVEKKTLDPTVEDYWAAKVGSTGNLNINVRSSGIPSGQTWKATISVRTYRLIGIRWQWVQMLYDIYCDETSWVAGDSFVIGSNWQYEWHAGACCGDYWINSDQVTLVSWTLV